ncbi:MFS transporter [Streptomyces rochei]|uniref:MFS transporter n=1 Tax=Streptomyces rochei TaxID=1928 RepID=UPI003695C1D0
MPAGSRQLLRHAPFRNQFLASVLSTVGNSLTPVALSLGVLEATGSASQLGLVLAAYSVPQVLFFVVGGVWADRLPRQHMMMAADAARVVTQTGFGLMLISGWAPLGLMMASQAICGTASSLFLPASFGLVTDTAPPERRQEANALLSLTQNLSSTLGPVCASALVVWVGAGWALIIDGFTFAASYCFLRLLDLPAREPGDEKEPAFFRELVVGWQEVTRRSWVWTTIAYCMVFNVCFAAYQVLGPAALVHKKFAALEWGLVAAALGLGQLLGSTVALVWRPMRPLLVGRLFMLGGAPVLVCLAVSAPLPLLLATSLLCGFAVSFPNILWEAALQEHIDSSALARVSSFDFLGSFVLRPVGLSLAGVCAGLAGTTGALVAAGCVMVVATVVSLLDRQVFRLPRTRPPEREPVNAL